MAWPITEASATRLSSSAGSCAMEDNLVNIFNWNVTFWSHGDYDNPLPTSTFHEQSETLNTGKRSVVSHDLRQQSNLFNGCGYNVHDMSVLLYVANDKGGLKEKLKVCRESFCTADASRPSYMCGLFHSTDACRAMTLRTRYKQWRPTDVRDKILYHVTANCLHMKQEEKIKQLITHTTIYINIQSGSIIKLFLEFLSP